MEGAPVQSTTIIGGDGEGDQKEEQQLQEWSRPRGSRPKAGPMAVGVHNVDLPAHVGGGVGVVVHNVRPGQVWGHLGV